MRCAAISFIILFIPAIGFSATIIVPDDQPTIQAAIGVAANGDTVLVKPGRYIENIDFKGKAITVKSQRGADVTVIDGNQAGHVVMMVSGEGIDSVLEGFTITNGSGALGLYGQYYGGGIYCYKSSPGIFNNIITDNSILGNKAKYGGGICCWQSSSPVIWNNVITENTASCGGGICCRHSSSPVILNNTIMKNMVHVDFTGGSSGGGIYCSDFSDPWITRNCIAWNASTAPEIGGAGIFCGLDTAADISGNIIEWNESWKDGGGICTRESRPEMVIRRNTIRKNTALNHGAGIEVWHASPRIADNTITENRAFNGGGISCEGLAYPLISNNIVSLNTATSGGGIHFNAGPGPFITNTTLYGNKAIEKGGGINCWLAYPEVVNSILWKNDAPMGPEVCLGVPSFPSALRIGHSDLEGGMNSVHIDPGCFIYLGNGLIDADPQFVDAGNGDFHLTFNSPCRDGGQNSVSLLPALDFEGDPRLAFAAVDMGADEFFTHLYYTGHAAPGGSVEIKFVGLPGTSPVVLWVGSGVLGAPIQTGFGDWHLDFPILFRLRLGAISSPDGVTKLRYTFAPGFTVMDIPMQALIGKRLTNFCVMQVE